MKVNRAVSGENKVFIFIGKIVLAVVAVIIAVFGHRIVPLERFRLDTLIVGLVAATLMYFALPARLKSTHRNWIHAVLGLICYFVVSMLSALAGYLPF